MVARARMWARAALHADFRPTFGLCTVSFWHQWLIAPPRSAALAHPHSGAGGGVGHSSPRGLLTVVFGMLNVWLLIVQVCVGVCCALLSAR